MYPELLTRRDLETFLPPIGGQTVYIFGNPAYLRDPTKELTVRVHDECNGSDVLWVPLFPSPFTPRSALVVQPKGNTRLTGSGSDICTCRPYLIYGIEEAVKCAQRGGVGLIVYFRKEGRALGEVTKCMFSYTVLTRAPVPVELTCRPGVQLSQTRGGFSRPLFQSYRDDCRSQGYEISSYYARYASLVRSTEDW